MNKTKAKARLLLSTLSVLLTLSAPLSASAQETAHETYAGSNQDVRTVLYFNVSPAALSKFLPQGWSPARRRLGLGPGPTWSWSSSISSGQRIPKVLWLRHIDMCCSACRSNRMDRTPRTSCFSTASREEERGRMNRGNGHRRRAADSSLRRCGFAR